MVYNYLIFNEESGMMTGGSNGRERHGIFNIFPILLAAKSMQKPFDSGRRFLHLFFRKSP